MAAIPGTCCSPGPPPCSSATTCCAPSCSPEASRWPAAWEHRPDWRCCSARPPWSTCGAAGSPRPQPTPPRASASPSWSARRTSPRSVGASWPGWTPSGGRPEPARAHAASALGPALDHGYAAAASVATWALGLAELGAGRPEEALATLLPLATPGSGRHHVTVALCACGDLVEAAQRAGETAAVTASLEALERLATATGQRWAGAVATRCRAVLGDADADEGFIAALDLHAGSTRPFEHARTALLYGEHLRRQRRRADARPHLRAALETFCGSAPSRGRREPAASCGPAARRPVGATRAPSPSSHPRSCRSCGS